MKKELPTKQYLNLKLETHDLPAQVVRLIKSVHSMMLHVAKVEDESEYFESSAELLRMCASLIKQSRFPENHPNNTEIPYGDQAIEYGIDAICEGLEKSKLVIFDN